VDAKGDAELCLIDPALAHSNVTLQTGSLVTRPIIDATGKRIVAAEVQHGGETQTISGELFVLSAGAVNSAALLLRSATSAYPHGLANSSGMVRRHYMNHNCTALMTIMPMTVNETHFPKTIAVNDYYFGGKAYDKPLGNLQLLGNIQEPMLRGALSSVPSGCATNWRGTAWTGT
jgi:choline dehydrogenase-like flavoprotein